MEDNQQHTSENSTKSQPPPMWKCSVCGAYVWNSNRNRHLRTKKHNDALYVLTEKFEIIK